jgi:hypothetical protein
MAERDNQKSDLDMNLGFSCDSSILFTKKIILKHFSYIIPKLNLQ